MSGRNRLGLFRTFSFAGFCLLLMLALGATAPVAGAATIPVTSESPGLGGPGECTLAAAIQAANTNMPVNGCPAGESTDVDIITIPECNLVLTAAFFTDGTDGPIGLPAITSDIIIDGFGTTQTFIRRDPGAPDFALFLVTSAGNLKIQQVTLQTGSAAYGGAIINRGILDIQFAQLTSNASSSTTMGGGAVANLGGTLNVNNTQFTSNTTQGLGGAIYNTGTATVSGGFFNSNSAEMSGGAIYSGGGNLTVMSGTFQSNSADEFGGAIYMTPGTMLTLTGAILQFNSVGGSEAVIVGGGALAIFGQATITNGTFSGNTATDSGAGMVFGGAIYSTSPNLSITKSSFFSNNAFPTSNSYGGAILLNGAATDQITITNSTMGSNSAGTGGAFSAMAGVILFNNVTVAQNTANNGGGVHAFPAASVGFGMRNTLVAVNTANVADPDCFLEPGGAITSTGHNLIGIGCTGFMAGTGDLVGTAMTPIDPTLIRTPSSARFFSLVAGSPAIDAGDPATPGSGGTSCESDDQRGIARPVGMACDIGAFEGTLSVADVGISMSDISSNLVQLGDDITFTLEVTNFGPQPATNVTLSHFINAQFALISATSTQGTCSGTTSISCAIGTMAVDDTVTVTIVVDTLQVILSPGFSFSVTRTEFDPVNGNNGAFLGGRVARDGDLEMVKFAPFQVAVGANASFTLTVRNHSTNSATNVVITDTMPAGFTVVTASLPTDCTEAMGTVTCTIQLINQGNVASRTVQATSTTPGMVTNTASVTATETDPDLTNNTASDDTLVRAATDIGVTKTDSPDPLVFSAGAQITYTVTVTNNGPADATNVVLSESLDFRTTLVSAMITQGTCTGTTFLSCDIGTMAPMDSVVLTVIVTVNEPCVARNTASVTMTELDTNFGNNSASAQTTVSGNPVTATADLSVTKTDSPDPVTAGEDLTYTVTVTNNGPDDAPAVTLMDVLPMGVTFVSAVSTQGTCSQSSGVVSCNIGTMLDGAVVTVTIVVTPNVGGTLTNTADVTSEATDPTPANNTATTTTTVQGPDIALTPTSLVFPTTAVGSSNMLDIVIESTGNATLTVTDIQITGVNAAEFTFPAVTLPLSLAPGAMQTVSITFSPAAEGTRSALFEVASNAVSGTPITAVLNGTAVVSGPVIVLNPVSVDFGNVDVGATSPAQVITVSNTGDAAAAISGITISGANAADFAQTNNCPASLAVGSNCTANLTFTPGVLGIRNAQFNVASNAAGSPATAALTGNGLDFVITTPPGAPTSATIVTGETITFPVSINNTGAPTTITLGCTTNAPASTCTVQPSAVMAGNGIPVSADVIVGTTSCVWTAPYSGRRTLPPVDFRLLLAYTWLLMMLAAILWRRVPQGRRAHAVLVLLLLWTGLAAGCSGEAEQFGFGTVPGTYTITVSAVSGASTQTQIFTITVTLPPGF